MKTINEVVKERSKRPVKVVQFGEGNFLRAFVDYMIDILNEKTDFNGDIVLVKDFAEAVTDRFKNPFIKHSLLAISLNSVSKWKARCMPSFTEYINRKGTLPEHLTFSLAALIAFYSGTEIRDGALIGHRNGEEYLIKDDRAVLEFFAENSSFSSEELADKVLGNVGFWGIDLRKYDGAVQKVSAYISDIRNIGMRKTLEKYFS